VSGDVMMCSWGRTEESTIQEKGPIKTSAKYHHLTVWVQGQIKWAKKA